MDICTLGHATDIRELLGEEEFGRIAATSKDHSRWVENLARFREERKQRLREVERMQREDSASTWTRLCRVERLVQFLLVDSRWPRWEKLDKFTASRRLRNKYTADDVKKAFEMLRDKGIVEYEVLRRPRGMHNVVIQKRAWSQITAHECGEAARFLRKLGVHRDAFESETRLVVEASGSVG